MKQIKLPVQLRAKIGRMPSRHLRTAGLIPAVVYGKSGVRHLTVREPDFRTMMRAISGTAAIVEIAEGEGASMLSLLQEIQRDPRTDRFVHVDFKEVSANEQMNATVPVHVIGEAIGVKMENGIIEVSRHEIDVKCLPKDLPDFITVDVSALHAGDSIHVRDLKPIEGVIFDEHADEVIAACVIPTVEEEEAPATAVAVEGEAAPADGAAPAAEGEAAKGADGKPAAGAKGAPAGAKGAAPAAGAKGAPAAGAKGAAPAAGAKPAGKSGGKPEGKK
jgi:large subunit ribosomal protein L25